MRALPPIPDDDLYARLGIPIGATTDQIDAAWRNLQRRHHPDVAGETQEATVQSRGINVARDWLSNPILRDHYDSVRGLRRGDTPPASTVRSPTTSRASAGRTRFDPWAANFGPNDAGVRDFLRRVASLNQDEIERMLASESTPSISGLYRFLPHHLAEAFDALERAVDVLIPVDEGVERELVRLVVSAAGFEHVAGDWLDRELTTLRDQVRELNLWAWERSTLQPRYGRRHAEVSTIVERLKSLRPQEASYLLVVCLANR